MGPAGGHFSTAPDLARLLLAELLGGQVAGQLVIEPAAIVESQRSHVPQSRDFGPIHRYGWGLGWDLGTTDGDTLLHRFGSFTGYRSHLSFMPRQGLGAVVLVNGGVAASPLADALAMAIYDRLLARPGARANLADRLAAAVERGDRLRASLVADRDQRAARPQALPLPIEAYAGRYVSPVLGTLVLEVVDGHLQAAMGTAHSPVEVFDAAKHQLRVELLGNGDVVGAILAEDGQRVAALTFLGERFESR